MAHLFVPRFANKINFMTGWLDFIKSNKCKVLSLILIFWFCFSIRIPFNVYHIISGILSSLSWRLGPISILNILVLNLSIAIILSWKHLPDLTSMNLEILCLKSIKAVNTLNDELLECVWPFCAVGT